MKSFERIRCQDFSCFDVNKSRYCIPALDIQSEIFKAVVISEAPPEKREDYFLFSLRTFLPERFLKGEPFTVSVCPGFL